MAEEPFAGRLLMSGVLCRSRAVGTGGDTELLRFGTGDRVESEDNGIVHPERNGTRSRSEDAERRSSDGSSPRSRSQGRRGVPGS